MKIIAKHQNTAEAGHSTGSKVAANETKEKGHLDELFCGLHSQISSHKNEIGFLRRK